MLVYDAELVRELAQLPIWVTGLLLTIGLGLWSCGWRLYRFWAAVFATLAGGVAGMQLALHMGWHPIWIGLLVAIGCGSLALALLRVFLFLLFGGVVWQFGQVVLGDRVQPIVLIVAGGLASVLFLRLCLVLLTSVLGVWIALHAGAGLIGHLLGGDNGVWAAPDSQTVHILFWGAVLLGVVTQYSSERLFAWWKNWRKEWHEYKQKKSGASSASLRKAG